MSIIPLKRDGGHFSLFRLNSHLTNMRNNIPATNELNYGADSNLIIMNKRAVKSSSIFNLDTPEIYRLNLNARF